MSQNIDYERFLYCIKWMQASYRNTTHRLTTDANPGLPDRCLPTQAWLRRRAGCLCNWTQSKLHQV